MRVGVFACVALSVAACAAAPVQDASSASTSSVTASPQEKNKVSAQQEVAKPLSDSATSATAASPVDATAQFKSTDAMLSALEKAGDNIRTLRANVIYDRVDAVSENRERRTGQIVLTQDSQQLKSRTLAIMFDQFIDASGHASPQTQRFVFHGGWLFEFDDARHQLTPIMRMRGINSLSRSPIKTATNQLPTTSRKPYLSLTTSTMAGIG